MAKVCFVLGEGGTEREFFPALLKKSFGFEDYEYLKYPYIFTKDDLWWIMFPSNVVNYNGCARLHEAETYKELAAFRDAHLHNFGENYELHFLVMRDGDYAPDESRASLGEKIKKVSTPILKQEPMVHIPFGEIENWFLAGLTETFQHFDPHKIDETKRLLACDLENCKQSKEKLDNVLVPEISGQRLLIAQEVGNIFDVAKARLKSRSCAALFDELERLGLL